MSSDTTGKTEILMTKATKEYVAIARISHLYLFDLPDIPD